ncbi:RecX family transcriptional regulator [Acholeplasma granularum]|uniref:RecX family transcriptional regulator n=1 Tax=Acholeplasma granularum TaxID=264635 RepID=UPI000470A6B2|nr:RecX family transcriptional regulator [Acholeplasma granularum]
MKVKTIEKSKGNYKVTFDNNFCLFVDEDTLVKFKLIPNQEIESLDPIYKSIEMIKIYKKAERFALYGKSENQVIKYLNDLGVENTYDMIIKLRKNHILNDFRMIRNLQNKGYSYLKLEEKLKFYQFDQKDIDQALINYDEQIPLYKEFKTALKKYEKEEYKKKQQKIYRYLVSKGFNEDKVMSLMNIN